MYPLVEPELSGSHLWTTSSDLTSPTSKLTNIPLSIPIFANAAYYPNWRVYKRQTPSSLRLGFVSHIFYAFAWLKENGEIYLSDEWADSQMPVDGTQGCLRSFAQLKMQHTGLKVILSVGGGGKGSENFAQVARNPKAVANFVASARQLVDQFQLDGIDIDWEHPADLRQGADYIYLLSRLRDALPSPSYLLTTALPAGEWVLKNINLLALQDLVEFINLMAYDFSGPWVERTAHQSQLFTPAQPHNIAAQLSCQAAVAYLLEQGVRPNKVLLGVPLYGRSFLESDNIDQSFSDCGGESGCFDYCDLPRPGATVHHDNEVCADYCSGGDGGFVTYDTPHTVKQKAKFVSDTGLGGLFYWQITADKRGCESLVETGYRTLHDI